MYLTSQNPPISSANGLSFPRPTGMAGSGLCRLTRYPQMTLGVHDHAFMSTSRIVAMVVLSPSLSLSTLLFPRGAGLKWRYEALRGRYGLSPDDARLVISIEDSKDYSENALKVAKHRERQMIEEILYRPPGECQGMSWEEYKTLRELFPKAQTSRIPGSLNSIWPSELVTFFEGRNLLGKTFSIPHRPPSRQPSL